ncbi:MAG: Zn-ribbon domain-containing OB-fold protein [Actinomycetota bacterium]|jgi:uncharacterized OB-fold protein|nr:Zn-ribbon domain-containing OB-fold protein [Actinomycetota bacterium]
MTRFDLPTPEGDTLEFWEAARNGRLLIKHCGACGAYSYYPRPFCPECWNEEVEWHEASGDATLYSWSVIYNNDQPPFRDRVPYVAAVVDLAEGPRMMTNVVDTPFDQLSVGMPLRVTFMVISDDYTIPVFTSVGTPTGTPTGTSTVPDADREPGEGHGNG